MAYRKNISSRSVGIALTLLGACGLFASVALLRDTIEVAKNPDFAPSCSINPILSCSSVMASEQAELFGIPNPVFGVIAFTALVAFACMITAGATFARWLWVCALGIALGGVGFAHYLFFQSMFTIGSICPWCSLVWVISIAILWLIISYVLDHEILKKTELLRRIRYVWHDCRVVVLIGWYLALLIIIFVRFSDYWMSLL